MAPTPRPAGWKGGSEDFGFLRTFDGHRAPQFQTVGSDEDRFGYANVRWGFDQADLNGDYYGVNPGMEDIHGDERDD